jgi:hypothetical protein
MPALYNYRFIKNQVQLYEIQAICPNAYFPCFKFGNFNFIDIKIFLRNNK